MAARRRCARLERVVFRVRSASDVLAAKVSQVDERERAAREDAALRVLAEAGLGCAPAPQGVVRVDGLDVLFSEWVEGKPLEEAPPGDSPAWRAVVDAYAEVRRSSDLRLAPTVLGVDLPQIAEDAQAAPAVRRRRWRPRRGPREASHAGRPAAAPPRPLHCEASLANFLRGSGGSLTIVDRENSGLGDACFDPANIVLAPQQARYDPAARDELYVGHARLLGDERLADRTRAHAIVMVAWWVVRLRQERAAAVLGA
ncbi:MAG TPA: phosphotransferase [Gaiellaceae bacterium]|nr:phosphotransferase [Gaiellaceae bacterium]